MWGQFGNSGQHGANGNHSMSACDPLRAPLSEESTDGAIGGKWARHLTVTCYRSLGGASTKTYPRV